MPFWHGASIVSAENSEMAGKETGTLALCPGLLNGFQPALRLPVCVIIGSA